MAFAAASSNTGLWQYDVATGQLWATEHCRSMLGLDSHALTPARVLRAVHPDDRRRAAATLRSVMHGSQAVGRGEFRVLHPNGDVRSLAASGHGDLGVDGKPAKISGVIIDITERKMAEAETRQLSQRLLTVQDEERRQIARELHDSTMQHLAAMGLNMMSLKARAASDAKMRKLCDDIGVSLGEASRELRTFSYLLHPPDLEIDGLGPTLRRFVDGFAARTGLKMKVSISPKADELPLQVQRSLLRVAQEALANVHRHASAKQVAVSLKCVADHIHLVVSDDGQGMNGTPAHPLCAPPKVGVGIPGMTARLRQLGGDLHIHSDATGTTLHGVVPMHVNGNAFAAAHHPQMMSKH
jgi:PAS domain S-box-containing protein